jgi:hypothetical protein
LNFNAKYIVKNRLKKTKEFFFDFKLPGDAGNITDVRVLMNDKKYTDDSNFADGIQWKGILKPQKKIKLQISYVAQGTKTFKYALEERKIEIKKLQTVLKTDFNNIRILDRAMVPKQKFMDAVEKKLVWNADNLITGQNISMEFEIDANYGKLVSRLFLFAPLSIFLFLGTILIFSIARGINLHPMNFLFLLTSFFIYYLLGSYIVSYIPFIAAIVISLVIALAIIIYYSHLIRKSTEFVYAVLFTVFLFQWIFSLAFFFPGHTGFLITISSIVAFVVLMRVTAKIDWENKW